MLHVGVVALLSAPLGQVVEVLCDVVPEYRPELFTLLLVLHEGFSLLFISTSFEYEANISTYCILGSILEMTPSYWDQQGAGQWAWCF